VSAWRTQSLGEIAESVDYGVTASATQQPIGPKFLRITDIQNGSVSWSSVPWCTCDVRSASQARLKSGDIVFARTGATTGKSFLIRDCPTDAVFASYLIRLRLGDRADPGFVSHYFTTPSYWAQIAKSARGVAQAGVNATALRSIEIPLPPLAQQRRIAAILDKANALRSKRREALAQLDALIQAIFLDMFGDPAINPKAWPVRIIADLIESATYGTSEKSEASGEIPVLRMNNITRSGGIDLTDLKYMSLKDRERERYLVRAGDLLFNRTNSADLVGKTGIYREARAMAYAGYLIRLRSNRENDPEYLAGFLNTAYAKRVLRGMCKSIIGMANINATEIKAMRIAQPPHSAQREFARRIGAVERSIATQRASLAELDTLFASLQYRAFRGEL
jgi:type I restriction enzyme S subunit